MTIRKLIHCHQILHKPTTRIPLRSRGQKSMGYTIWPVSMRKARRFDTFRESFLAIKIRSRICKHLLSSNYAFLLSIVCIEVQEVPSRCDELRGRWSCTGIDDQKRTILVQSLCSSCAGVRRYGPKSLPPRALFGPYLTSSCPLPSSTALIPARHP